MPFQGDANGPDPLTNDEDTRRLGSPSTDEGSNQCTMAAEQSTKVARRLYISHALSTWNSRMFEFGAFLFLARVFPGTLLFASIYALARSLAVFLLSSWVGAFMDKSNRLSTIRSSISEQYPAVDGMAS